MDPIHPIAPGPPLIGRASIPPVERISRERDRPTRDERQQQRDPAYRRASDPEGEESVEDDDGRPHIDVRV